MNVKKILVLMKNHFLENIYILFSMIVRKMGVDYLIDVISKFSVHKIFYFLTFLAFYPSLPVPCCWAGSWVKYLG